MTGPMTSTMASSRCGGVQARSQRPSLSQRIEGGGRGTAGHWQRAIQLQSSCVNHLGESLLVGTDFAGYWHQGPRLGGVLGRRTVLVLTERILRVQSASRLVPAEFHLAPDSTGAQPTR